MTRNAVTCDNYCLVYVRMSKIVSVCDVCVVYVCVCGVCVCVCV